MSLMASAMKAECRSATRRLGVLLDLALADRTRHWSNITISSDTLGPYVGLVDQFGILPWGVPNDRSFAISPIECQPTVIDTSEDFLAFLEGSSGVESLIKTPPTVTIKLISPNVAAASWFTLFTGILVKWGYPVPGKVQLTLRTNTTVLDAIFGRFLAAGDWPYADQSARELIAPMIYGVHDSGGEKGAIPCILVDTTLNRYLVAVGWMKTVDRVYVGNVQQTSGYSVSHPTINGRVYTCIDFTSQQTADVAADVTGYEPNGDGSGTLIENPADQLSDFLSNYVYGSHTTGARLSTNAIVDSTAFTNANAFLARTGQKGSRRIADAGSKAIDILNEWCECFQARPYWSNLGLIGVKFEDLDLPSILIDDPWLKQSSDGVGFGWTSVDEDLSWEDDTLELISRVEVEYQRNEARNIYSASLMVQESGISFGAPDKLSLPWSYSGQ